MFHISYGFRIPKILDNFLTGLEIITKRHGHHMRGLPPGVARTLNQRLEELNYKDPELSRRIDIGLPITRTDRLKKIEIEFLKSVRKDVNLERESRNQTLRINLDETFKEWCTTVGPKHIKVIGDHYGIFEHLFGDAYFYPIVPLNVSYLSEDAEHPVYFGNIIKPSEATEKPKITYSSEEDKLWTLIMTNLDGHFTDNEKEYVHWFIGNIPGSSIEKGDIIVDYLQPFPPRGTGYHRFAFILYLQDNRIDCSKFKQVDKDIYDLEARTFSTLEFYREQQDSLTPAGLAFFQSHWDNTVRKFYHEKLQMKEPLFEYDFDPPYIRPQKWFPLRQPFNLYMDKYRDPKQINKEFLQRKLKNVHPFKPPLSPIPFPNAVPWSKPYIPSWLKLEITKSRLKWGRINDIE